MRWESLALDVGKRLASRADVIHVMDREADAYETFAGLQASGQKFVIRLSHDRSILSNGSEPEFAKIFAALESAEPIVEREVPISRRPKRKQSPRADRLHPPREGRLARLKIAVSKIEVKRSPGLSKDLPASVTLNYVRVFEVDVPEGEEAVEWRLMTTESTETVEDILNVVDWYRARWVVEEFFKALKTGCGFEKLQLESLPALLHALAIFPSVAWRLLMLRSLARNSPEEPASQALTEIQVKLLVADPKLKVPKQPTIRQAMLGIAALGGHIKNNGDPGWLTLGRGFDRLLEREMGWITAQETILSQSV